MSETVDVLGYLVRYRALGDLLEDHGRDLLARRVRVAWSGPPPTVGAWTVVRLELPQGALFDLVGTIASVEPRTALTLEIAPISLGAISSIGELLTSGTVRRALSAEAPSQRGSRQVEPFRARIPSPEASRGSTAPSRLSLSSAPAGGSSASRPADGSNTSRPADGSNTSRPADGSSASRPADGSNTSRPATLPAPRASLPSPTPRSTLPPARPAEATRPELSAPSLRAPEGATITGIPSRVLAPPPPPAAAGAGLAPPPPAAAAARLAPPPAAAAGRAVVDDDDDDEDDRYDDYDDEWEDEEAPGTVESDLDAAEAPGNFRTPRPGESYVVYVTKFRTIADFLEVHPVFQQHARLVVPFAGETSPEGTLANLRLSLPGKNVFELWALIGRVTRDEVVVHVNPDSPTFVKACAFPRSIGGARRLSTERPEWRGPVQVLRLTEERSRENLDDMPVRRRLARMTMEDKINMALSGTREERMALAMDGNKAIHHYLLKNARISLDEIAFIARLPTMNPDVLMKIGESPNYVQNQQVVKNLVYNPKTPPPLAIRLLDRLPRSEIMNLAKRMSMNQRLVQAAKKKLEGKSK